MTRKNVPLLLASHKGGPSYMTWAPCDPCGSEPDTEETVNARPSTLALKHSQPDKQDRSRGYFSLTKFSVSPGLPGALVFLMRKGECSKCVGARWRVCKPRVPPCRANVWNRSARIQADGCLFRHTCQQPVICAQKREGGQQDW